MEIIRSISSKAAADELEEVAANKFDANEMISYCICRCSDG